MKLKDFLEFFDFSYEKYENGYGVIDLQGANLGDIESERYEAPYDIVARFDDSIYIPDYIDDLLEEDGFDMECTWENQYNWCVKHNHPYKDICYAFLHPETVIE